MSDEPRTTSAHPAAVPTGERPGELSGRGLRTLFAGLLVAMFIAALASTIIATGLPAVAGELGGADKVSWVIAGHLLTNCATTPLWGRWSDLYGRRPLLLLAIGVFAGGTLLCALAWDIWALIAFRGIQGIGVGGVITLCQAVIGDVITPTERSRYQGWIGASFAASMAIGPLLGGILVDHVGWRWCFFGVLPFAAVVFVIVHRGLRLPVRRARASVDVTGATLLVCAVSALLLLVTFGGDRFAWTSAQSYALGSATVVLLAATVAWERRVPEPLWPPRLFRDHSFTAQSAAALLMGSGMYATMVFLPQYFQLGRGLTATEAALLGLPFIAANLAGSTLSGRIIARTGRVKVFPVIGMSASVCSALLFAWLTPWAPPVALIPALIVGGLGVGFTAQVLVLAVQSTVEPRDLGIATGSVTFFRTLGGTISTAVFGVVILRVFTADLPGRLAEHGVPEGDVPPGDPGSLLAEPSVVNAYPDALRDAVHAAYASGTSVMYLAALPPALLGLLACLLMRDTRLPRKAGRAATRA